MTGNFFQNIQVNPMVSNVPVDIPGRKQKWMRDRKQIVLFRFIGD